MITIGYYLGKDPKSQFFGERVKDIPAAQMWLKNKLEWLEKNSYGFIIWESNSWKDTSFTPAKDPRNYISWHRDGTKCYGELYNPLTGWRFIVTSQNKIREEHVPPKENL